MRRSAGRVARLTWPKLEGLESDRILPVIVFGTARGAVSRACRDDLSFRLASMLSAVFMARCYHSTLKQSDNYRTISCAMDR
jgi:hypothetical protein